MNLQSRLAKLERDAAGDGCPECQMAEGDTGEGKTIEQMLKTLFGSCLKCGRVRTWVEMVMECQPVAT